MNTIEVTFYPQAQVDDALFKFAVIVARYEDKWIYCRHKARTTWEIPGGHREAGERIEDTARRELWEETGALEAQIEPVSAYGVTREGSTTYGMLFWAYITKLGPLSEATEIGEIKLVDIMPKELTYPEIQPKLYSYVQNWLNMQSGAGEPWDVYDENRCFTGRVMHRGEPIAEGDYHLVVTAWLLNSKGEFLLTKRSPNKGFPNMWETTGGSALSGDDSLTAVIREVKEETGLTLLPEKGSCIRSKKGDTCFSDVWLFRQDFDLKDVVLLEGETCDVMYASPEKIRLLRNDGILCSYSYLDELLECVVSNKPIELA